MPEQYRMRRIIKERYNKEVEEVIPQLMALYAAPYRVAAQLDVTPYSVRHWLEKNGWHFDRVSKQWKAPTPQAQRELHELRLKKQSQRS